MRSVFLRQGEAAIAPGLAVGPVTSADTVCPLAILGVVARLTEEQRRRLAAYLVAGLSHNHRTGSLCSQILDLHHDDPAGTFKRGSMESAISPESAS